MSPYPTSRLGNTIVDENIDLHKILEKKSHLHSQRVSDVYANDYQTMRDQAASPYSSLNNKTLMHLEGTTAVGIAQITHTPSQSVLPPLQ